MNIFYLDDNPKTAAQYHCNKHVVKMILETAQLLSAAHIIIDDIIDNDVLYKLTHKNHPSSVWVRDNINNYNWTYQLFLELCNEYTFRYFKTHASFVRLNNIIQHAPKNISTSNAFFAPPQCMPDYCKHDDTVIAYRQYYVYEKGDMLQYKIRDIPNWINDIKTLKEGSVKVTKQV